MTRKKQPLTKTEEYSLNFNFLMNKIPRASVAKQIRTRKEGQETVLSRSIRWVVDEYAIYSETRSVNAISQSGYERFFFCLKAKDYEKFVKACEDRRAVILEQIRVKNKSNAGE